jgi:hypothetical protein
MVSIRTIAYQGYELALAVEEIRDIVKISVQYGMSQLETNEI